MLKATNRRDLSTFLSIKTLYAERHDDFTRLEACLRHCESAAVLLSDDTMRLLDQKRDQIRLVLDTLAARTGKLLAWCRTSDVPTWIDDCGVAQALDISTWAPDQAAPACLLRSMDQVLDALDLASGVRTVGLPLVVVAMTREEADGLAARPEKIEDELGRDPLRQFYELNAALNAYGAPPFEERYDSRREQWRPFFDRPTTADGILREMVSALNRGSDPRLRGRRVKIQHYPFDALLNESHPLDPVYREIAKTGCVMLVDELSLYCPAIRKALLASPFFGSEQVAVVTISPLNPFGKSPYSMLESELRSRLATIFSRFSQDNDPQCELSVGDERRLKRWLFNSLPQAIEMLREPAADRGRIEAFAQELGRKPGHRVAGLLYSEGGLL